MPELPEVETARRHLEKALKAKRLKHVFADVEDQPEASDGPRFCRFLVSAAAGTEVAITISSEVAITISSEAARRPEFPSCKNKPQK